VDLQRSSHWHVHSGWGLRELPYRALGWLDTRHINRFAAVTTLSRWMTEVGEHTFVAPVQMVRCGIDARRIPPMPDRSFSAGAGAPVLRLLSIGILAPWRRLEDALRAVAVARQRGCACRYEIIGSDRFWPSYGALLRELVASSFARGRGAAVRVGHRVELEAAYARADAAVFPNEQQAWGLAQLEAMVRGVPVVVFPRCPV